MITKTFLTTGVGRDSFGFIDSSEIPDLIRQHRIGSNVGWTGDNYNDMLRKAELGDTDLVRDSEEFLHSIEDQIPVSRGWRSIDDVVGAVPNVPAFLAGHPQHMRRKQRVARDNAPLTIYMDLTSSGGINHKDVSKRGVVLLALTRMLVEHRPVELRVGTSLGARGYSSTISWRIDTAPLDLARAAFHIGAASMSRSFGYQMCRVVMPGCSGAWPFNNYDLHCRTAESRLRVATEFGDILYVPPIYLDDPMTRNPVGWLKGVLKQYVGEQEGED